MDIMGGMYLRRFAQKVNPFLALLIGLSLLGIEGLCQENLANADPQLVEVELSPLIPLDSSGSFYLLPYRYRRTTWGSTLGLSFGTFVPLNFEPNYYADEFGDVYGDQSYGMVELHFSIKRNFSLFSLGLDLGTGFYNASAAKGYQSNISVIPIRAGLRLSLEGLSDEGYFVPYVAGGAYTMMYDESQSGNSSAGNTQAALYGSAGVQVQINWLDPVSAIEAYRESGIENSFVFAEARYFGFSAAPQDPDFSAIYFSLGMMVEF